MPPFPAAASTVLPMNNEVADAIQRETGARPEEWTSVTGGDVSNAFKVVLDDHRIVFVKTHAAPPEGFFTTEASGLSWLREPGALPVPEVLAVADDPAHLVLEWIEEGDRHGADEEAFGRSLAALHRAGAPCFGREDRRTTGSRGLPNDPCDTWAEFYGSQRLEPLARLARDTGALDASSVRAIDRIAARLDDLGGDTDPPARLHGDLWGGNRVVDVEGTSWLIDPAAHGGHREFDLAMMRLFGGFGEGAFAAYADAAPLAEGWNDRVPLHQLAPLIVHAVNFGGGYVPSVESALRQLS